MKKNVLIIVIDALSKWYIDQCKEATGFFAKMEKKGYCANNMFSVGPFTEAATRGLWASQDTLKGMGYLCESYFENIPFYDLFRQNNYYIYMGELIPFFTYKIGIDNTEKREACEVRGFDHIWRSRLQYFINLKKEGKFFQNSYWKMEFLLDRYFENYGYSTVLKKEWEKYENDKRAYINEILLKDKNSSFFINQDSSLYFACTYKNQTNLLNTLKQQLLIEEHIFINQAKYKNLEYLIELNQKQGDKESIEKELGGTNNRCVQSNNDLISHMREGYEKLPKLKKELKDFLAWYDRNENAEKPFLAYIHNFDFHYPENFMNNRYEDYDAYCCELNDKLEKLKNLKCCKMSVSKQLSIMNIEKCLECFWEELEKRHIFENTYVILTADHGISNFMYPVDRSAERWNYKKTNFQIPFYMQGCGIEPCEDNAFKSAVDILPTLIEKCELRNINSNYIGKSLTGDGRKYLFATWINGIPDLDYKVIKVGIRNEKYSITCEAYITQFIASGKVVGVYDLENDPDECFCLNPKDIRDDSFTQLVDTLKDKWFETIMSVLTDEGSPYGFYQRYKFLKERQSYYKQYNKQLKKMSWKEFDALIQDKEIILFGVSANLYSLLKSPMFVYKVKEIWDNDANKQGKCVLGNPVYKPDKRKINSNIFVVITSRFELEIVQQLCEMEIKRFCIGALIE